MKQAAALKDYQGSVLLPGIKISTGPWNFRPIKHLRLGQFDGRTWQPIGEVLETEFSNAQKYVAPGLWSLAPEPPRSGVAMEPYDQANVLRTCRGFVAQGSWRSWG